MTQNIFSEDTKWEFALKNSKVGVWDWDTTTNLVFYSTESKSLIGLTDQDTITTAEEWDNKVHPDDRAAYYQNFKEHLKGASESYRNEHRVLCKDGTYKWILYRGKVVSKDANGNPLRIIGTHTDISERKKTEEQLKQNLSLISSQNKRLHNFTHIVSHNLRTHIGNFDNILKFYDEAESPEEKEEMVTHLKTISHALTETIKDLSEIISIKSKTEIEQLNAPLNLKNCLDRVLESLELEISNNNVFVETNVEDTITLIGNTSYVESIFHNLISNSIKYKKTNIQSRVSIDAVQTKNEIIISISDNGIGIDMDKYKHQLFEMYQTFHGTKREDSKGVGLYLVKNQIEVLNGKIEVDSELGVGTTFTITF
jgi:PAS domain S-box-containing protein